MSSPFLQKLRDDSPALTESLFREAAITKSRFEKAAKVADLLALHGIDVDDLTHLTDDIWNMVCKGARVRDASLVTRVLVECIMQDRQGQKR